MARKTIFILSLIVGVILYAQIPTKYYIGKVQVPVNVYTSIADSLKRQSEYWDYDTLRVKIIHMPYTHYLDSISIPGEYFIKKRTPEQIAELSRLFNAIYEEHQECKLSIGDSAPNFSLINNIDGDTIPYFLHSGKCYLLNFWATWCGNCLKELEPEYIPAITDKFIEEKDFQFVPICIDVSTQSLRQFFNTKLGKRFE